MTDADLQANLKYIADSPPQEAGGFHPQTVETARAASDRIAALLAENEALRKELAALRERKCEGCGLRGDGEYIKIHVTNGVLTLCRQCLDDVNRKNPELPAIRQCAEKAEAELADSDAHLKEEIRLRSNAQRDLATAVEVVKSVEWGGWHMAPHDDLLTGCCPSCDQQSRRGHLPDCQLAAVLSKQEGKINAS